MAQFDPDYHLRPKNDVKWFGSGKNPTGLTEPAKSTGGLHAEMVVVPPQVAIVGAGRTFKRLVLEGDAVVEHRILPLSITFDHRVVTGAETCEFLAALIRDLELTD